MGIENLITINEPYGKRKDGTCNHAWLYFLNGPPYFENRPRGYRWCAICKVTEND